MKPKPKNRIRKILTPGKSWAGKKIEKPENIREPGFLVLINLLNTSLAVTGGFVRHEPILGTPPIRNDFAILVGWGEGRGAGAGSDVHAPVLGFFFSQSPGPTDIFLEIHPAQRTFFSQNLKAQRKHS